MVVVVAAAAACHQQDLIESTSTNLEGREELLDRARVVAGLGDLRLPRQLGRPHGEAEERPLEALPERAAEVEVGLELVGELAQQVRVDEADLV